MFQGKAGEIPNKNKTRATGHMVIRQIATSLTGSKIAAAEFEHTVHVWDIDARSRISTFETSLDFGGKRLAITADGAHCVAAAYRVHGVALYSTANGAEVWRRKDLKKTQTLRVSVDDRRVFCCLDEGGCQVLNRDTGKTISSWPGVRDVWESAYASIALLEERSLVLQAGDGRKTADILPTTFAVLSVAFAPGFLAITESSGPVRCIETDTGKEVWRHVPARGQHVLNLAYSEPLDSFVGVSWPYEHGGTKRLLRFDSRSGAATTISNLGQAAETAFCKSGSYLLLSDGSVIEIASGERMFTLAFSK